jgi:hypothetical protein
LLGAHRMVSRDTDYQFKNLAAEAEGLPVGIPSASWKVTMRYLLTLSGLLLFASLGAFFLLVPILPIMVGATMLASLMLMFGLGLQVGRRRIPLAAVALSPTTLGQVPAFGYAEDKSWGARR